LVVCSLFTAFTGASGVTIIAMGALLFPAMSTARYRSRFSLGLITTSGSLGLLFAPSLPLILYGVIAEQSVDDLFVAGVLPGLLMIAALSLYCIREGTFVKARTERPPVDRHEAVAAIRESIWEIPLPVIVLGGVYSGLFAVSEAAVVTVIYVFVVEVLVYRDIPLTRLPQVMRDSMMLVGGILIILGVSLASTNLMIDQQVPSRLFEWITAHISSKLSFLILLNLFLLGLGMMLDIFSALVLVVPLILPIAAGYGIDPIHLGMIFLANMQIGYCTPPVGMNLFIASYRFDRPVVELYRAAVPFLLILFATVLVITYWPWLTLVLVR
jgi:tripartite ATP-independent transporter DctM subunit